MTDQRTHGDDSAIDDEAPLSAPPIRNWPEQLTPALREILGIPNFQAGPMAHVYQAAGEFGANLSNPLRTRAEDEQAFILHKLVGFLISHGPDGWRNAMADDLDRALAKAKAAG